MTQFQIPAARSEFTATIPVTRTQRLVVMCDLGFSFEEIGGLYEYVVVDEALVASIAKAGEEFKAETGRSSSEKAAVTRVVNLIKNGFDSEYEARLANFRREVAISRRLAVDTSEWDTCEYETTVYANGSIAGRYVVRNNGWDRSVTSSAYIDTEFVMDGDEFFVQFVVDERGFRSPSESDRRFSTLAEAQERLRLTIDWSLALFIDQNLTGRANLVEGLARLDTTLDLLAAAGVDVSPYIAA